MNLTTAHLPGLLSNSPYTVKNVDRVIHHLERVLCADAGEAVFPLVYWKARIVQANATPGMTLSQQERLRRLLDSVEARAE